MDIGISGGKESVGASQMWELRLIFLLSCVVGIFYLKFWNEWKTMGYEKAGGRFLEPLGDNVSIKNRTITAI